MRRGALWVIFAAALAFALACVAAEIASYSSRPVLVPMGSTSGPAWEVTLRDGRLHVWRRPAIEHRPTWSGQIHRLGFRYTRWSNAAWDLGVPLRLVMAVGAAVGAASVVALWFRRRRAARGFPLSPTPPAPLQSPGRVRD
jgi:hypothetical protein